MTRHDPFNIYLIGVGGQGIGLLSEAPLRASAATGHPVVGVDTHGLAQRGGTVVSHLRLGHRAHSPLVAPGAAHVVVALERHEALRGMNTHLRDGGTLVWYDATWQPLAVRLGKTAPVEAGTIAGECARRKIDNVRVFVDDLADARMQNVAVLAAIARRGIVPGVGLPQLETALGELLAERVLTANLDLLRRLAA